MRTDNNVSKLSFRHSGQWRTDPFAGVKVPEIDRRLEGVEVVDGRLVVHSLSGHERNHLFMNRSGKTFEDVSLVSGLDNPADSRGFVTLDYDRDGRLDVALVNANRPLLNLYRNQSGQAAKRDVQNQFIAIRFVGANHTAQGSQQACRDGYGAMVQVTVAGAKLMREHRCGEGYGAQNSATMIVGMGGSDVAEQLHVRWPSGTTAELTQVAAGSLVTAFEDAQQADSGTHFDVQPYATPIKLPRPLTANTSRDTRRVDLSTAPSLPTDAKPEPRMKVYVTMATWCTACIDHMPHLRRITASMDDRQVELIGVPVDPDDSPDKLAAYRDEIDPPYRLIVQLTPAQREQVDVALATIQPPDAIPATIVTDGDGRILYATAGAPTISELRKLLLAVRQGQP